MTIKETHVSKRNEIFNLPNILTYGRILAVAALVGAYFMKGDAGTLDGAGHFFRRRDHRFF